MFSKKLKAVLFAIALTFGLSAQAEATGILDFGMVAPTTGTISFAGGATPLIGTNIQVDNVVGLGTPANNFVLRNCVGCVLNFTTGNFVSNTGTTTWNFGPGGSITVVGGVDLDNSGGVTAGDIPAGTTLLSGSFAGNVSVTTTGGTFRVFGAGFTDVKDANLAAFYGLTGGPAVPYKGGINLSFQASGAAPGAFRSSSVLSGDIVNEQVDLPSSLLLLGSGLVGFAYLTARSRRS